MEFQRSLAGRVIPSNDFGKIRTIAGVDVSVKSDRARAAVVVVEYPSLKTVLERVAETRVTFPYVPGLLAFRELPAVFMALQDVEADLLMADAHGFSHPRRFGLACHLGVALDKPVIGAAKSRLCGTHDEPAMKRGSTAPLRDMDEIIGTVLRTRDRVSPIYVSIGHRVSLATGVEITLACARTRIPEPTRLADKLSKRQ